MNFTLYNAAGQGLNWLLPKHCLNCAMAINHQRDHICEACYPKLPFQSHYCSQCGQNFSANTDFCGRCINTPPTFDYCFCPFKYEASIKELICKLKYRGHPELAKTAAYLLEKELLGHNFGGSFKNGFELPDALIAVPMHISRLRERGYNQSTLIAQNLSKTLKIPLLKNTLSKPEKTKPQAQQSLKQRKNNLKGSFRLNKTINAKSVAIIDDVVTTGSTAEEISKILKKNGVDYVQVWGVAHTL